MDAMDAEMDATTVDADVTQTDAVVAETVVAVEMAVGETADGITRTVRRFAMDSVKVLRKVSEMALRLQMIMVDSHSRAEALAVLADAMEDLVQHLEDLAAAAVAAEINPHEFDRDFFASIIIT